MNKLFLFSTIAILTAFASPAFAEGDESAAEGVGHKDAAASEAKPGGPRRGHRRHLPPLAAITACKGKKSEEACIFSGPNSDRIQGKCFSPEEGKHMACRPNEMPRPMGPPHGEGSKE